MLLLNIVTWAIFIHFYQLHRVLNMIKYHFRMRLINRSRNTFLFSRMNVRLLIITQITNALRYLESENLVHQDISARNCLIYPNHEIKLTNTAITLIQFQSHYYKRDQCRLPIRWMAPEIISNVKMIYLLN